MKRRYWVFAALSFVLFLAAGNAPGAYRVPSYRVEYVCFDGPDELTVNTVEKTIRVNCVPDLIFASSLEE